MQYLGLLGEDFFKKSLILALRKVIVLGMYFSNFGLLQKDFEVIIFPSEK